MYSNKENVNILTALLVAYGVRHAVVCPGSRNAPLVHNLNECPVMDCFPVTDERSAGFCALGMAQVTGLPVVVCVTSGSALLNLLPAVAEAFYQSVPLIVVSADRPPQWIGQQDGQTMPQPDALGRFVKRAVTLPEPHGEEERWFCNRLVNEALLAVSHHGNGPVHINVPISEPLYDFSVSALPQERSIVRENTTMPAEVVGLVTARLSHAERAWVIAGLGCSELLAPWMLATNRLAEALAAGQQSVPDFVLYLGGTLVSKPLKAFLRQSGTETWMVSEDGEVHDVTMNLSRIIECDPVTLVAHLAPPVLSPLLQKPAASLQHAAVQCFEESVGGDAIVHYANSTAVRLGALYARHHFWCNRGLNGIEGSLSTAAGCSLVTERLVCCVTGDLSFFYDQNALWNQNLRGNLRILLLNNGGGGIFSRFEGLKESAARDRLVMAKHQTTAEGICMQNRVGYRVVASHDELEQGMAWLLHADSHRPLLLEVILPPNI